jgi:hypothetical protein
MIGRGRAPKGAWVPQFGLVYETRGKTGEAARELAKVVKTGLNDEFTCKARDRVAKGK